eukprot:g10732.t1
MLGKVTQDKGVLPWECVGPGRCWHLKVDATTGAASFVLQPKRLPNIDLEFDGFTPARPKATRGAVQRNRYNYRFKAHVIQQLRILEENRKDLWDSEHLSPLQYLETHMRVHHANICKWAKNEDAIVRNAASDVTMTLLAKEQPRRWFPAVEKELYRLFLDRRKRKLKVSTLWLTVTFRKLLEEKHPADNRAAAFRPSFRWMQKWAKRHSVVQRRRTNLKAKSVEERLPEIKQFHRGFRKLLKEPVRRKGAIFPVGAALSTGETRLEKYGQFQLDERFDVDQVPLPFVNGLATTWEVQGSTRVVISQPFPGLEKRQCTMQVIFGPRKRVMRIALIFRGTGKRISRVEKAAYHKNVDVFFQKNAWADQEFCMEWAKKSYRPSLMRGRSQVPRERTLLLTDNLHAQRTPPFKDYLSKHCNTLAWYFPANTTDELQPVDAGAGRMLKVEVGKQQDAWLEQSDNIERWESNDLTASDRRVLITQWVGSAMQKLDDREEYRFRLFEKCGMAMTVDGSGDDRINLEGLDKPYSFMSEEDSNDEDDSDDEEASETHNAGSGGEDDQRGGSEGDHDVEGMETRNEGPGGGSDHTGGAEGGHDGERMEDGDSSDEDDNSAASGQVDELTLVDEDDSMDSDDEIQGMEIPDGFRIQAFYHAKRHMHLPLSVKTSRRAVLRQRLTSSSSCYTIGCAAVFCVASFYGGNVPLWGNGVCEVFFTVFYPFRAFAVAMVAALWVNSLPSQVLSPTSFAARLKENTEARQVFGILGVVAMATMLAFGVVSWFDPPMGMKLADMVSAFGEALAGLCIMFVGTQTFVAIGQHQQPSEASRAFYGRARRMLVIQMLALNLSTVVYLVATWVIHYTVFGRYTPLIPMVLRFLDGMLGLCTVVHFARPDRSTEAKRGQAAGSTIVVQVEVPPRSASAAGNVVVPTTVSSP